MQLRSCIVHVWFVARDLAAHLVVTKEVEARERLIRDAELDAALLAAPIEFWSRVADEYEKRSLHAGVTPSEATRATLRQLRGAAS